MMPPNIPPPASPTPTPSPAPVPAVFATAFDDTELVHTDYDLRPLAVRSLDHYVTRNEEDERFHVR